MFLEAENGLMKQWWHGKNLRLTRRSTVWTRNICYIRVVFICAFIAVHTSLTKHSRNTIAKVRHFSNYNSENTNIISFGNKLIDIILQNFVHNSKTFLAICVPWSSEVIYHEEKYNRQHGMARRFQAHKNDGSYMPVIVSANLFFWWRFQFSTAICLEEFA